MLYMNIKHYTSLTMSICFVMKIKHFIHCAYFFYKIQFWTANSHFLKTAKRLLTNAKLGVKIKADRATRPHTTFLP